MTSSRRYLIDILHPQAPTRGHFLCLDCISKVEREMAETIPEQDLPLYISYPWLYEEPMRLYQIRLKSL